MEKRAEALTMDEFVAFYKKMMAQHRWGIAGHSFWVKYIESIIDTRDGTIWSIILLDNFAEEEVWQKIPEAWKIRSGSMINIVIREKMDDNYKTLKERCDYLLSL